jgi:hypothetical protein
MSFFCLWSDSSFFGVLLVFKTKEQMLPMEMKMMLQMEEQKECKQMLPMACKVHQQMEVGFIPHMPEIRFRVDIKVSDFQIFSVLSDDQ